MGLSSIFQAIKDAVMSSTALKVGIGAVGVGVGALAISSAFQGATSVSVDGHSINVAGIAILAGVAIGAIILVKTLWR